MSRVLIALTASPAAAGEAVAVDASADRSFRIER